MDRNNLYYLFLEDKVKHPMPKEHSEKILKKILEIYKKIKPA